MDRLAAVRPGVIKDRSRGLRPRESTSTTRSTRPAVAVAPGAYPQTSEDPGLELVVRTASVRQARAARASLRVGDLVVCRTNDLGAGKAVGRTAEGLIEIEYFDNVGQPAEDRHREYAPIDALKPLPLDTETRVFWQADDGRWRSGRILGADTEREYVAVRGYQSDGFIKEADAYVRWSRPLTDVLSLALAHSFESPYLMELRRPFLQHVLGQRAAARGIPAITSSVIEHHQHQLDIARRVLEDPTQRYLLADEVGLGKTIEAGLVLRQLLLDNPGMNALVITPPYLRDQWRDELEQKFLIKDFPAGAVNVVCNDEPETWQPSDLLIVDEVHHLASLRDHPQLELATRYKALQRVAHDSPRVLLLSATPVLHNERTFLTMLHLLDPQMYPLDQLDDFRAKMGARQELSLVLHTLTPSTPAFLLRRKLPQLRELLPEDAVLAGHVETAQRALEEQSWDALEGALRRVQVHVSEVHRLHRRMLRTRRSEALVATFPLAGRSAPALVPMDASVSSELDALVDEWRQTVAASVEDGDQAAIDRGARMLARVVEASSDPVVLAEWAGDRLNEAAAELPVTDDERAALERMRHASAYAPAGKSRVQAVVDAVLDEVRSSERAVVFTRSTHLARSVARELRSVLGNDVVVQHLAGDATSEATSALRSFEAGDASFLVCDWSAEEGRNLQFADMLVHVDLPADPNRLEQRIGRVDRWSTDPSTTRRSLLVADQTDLPTLWNAWRQIVSDGFGVFDGSIAALQHAVEEQALQAWRGLLSDGVRQVDDIIGSVRQALDEERERIRQLDALDAIQSAEDDQEFLDRLHHSESRQSSFAQTADRLLNREGIPGNLRFHLEGDPTHATGSYALHAPWARVAVESLPLISGERLSRTFAPLAGNRASFDRSVAVRTRDVRVYRHGEPFVDAVADFLWHDDRGRAWAMWRHRPRWEGDEAVYFRFDFRVHADTAGLERVVVEDGREGDLQAVRRRADAAFPPRVAGVWVDQSGTRVEDEEMLALLQQPYRKPPPGFVATVGGDYHLSERRIWAAEELLPAGTWERGWTRAYTSAQALISDDLALRAQSERAITRAQRLGSVRVEQLRLRADHRDATLEENLLQALLDGIGQPSIFADSAGMIVVSSSVPAAFLRDPEEDA